MQARFGEMAITEFLLFVLTATLGGIFLCGANDLITIFVAPECLLQQISRARNNCLRGPNISSNCTFNLARQEKNRDAKNNGQQANKLIFLTSMMKFQLHCSNHVIGQLQKII